MDVFDIVKEEDLERNGLEFKVRFHDWLIYSDGNNTRYALKPLENGYLVCSIYDVSLAVNSPFMYPLLNAEGVY